MPEIAVVIVSWNTREVTRKCLASLQRALVGLDAQVWVIDNASLDGSPEMVRTEFPAVNLIENDENLGFARANNQVLKTVEADYYLLLNSDAFVGPTTIQDLLSFARGHPEAGAVAPRLQDPDGTVQTPSCRFPGLWQEFKYCLAFHFFPFSAIFRKRRKRARSYARAPGPIALDVLSSACLLLPARTIEEVGILSEKYFIFGEENDYFRRLKKWGWTAHYLPGVTAVHGSGESRSKLMPGLSQAHFIAGRLKFAEDYFPGGSGPLRAMYAAFFAWSLAVASIKGMFRRTDGYRAVYRSLLKTVLSRSEPGGPDLNASRPASGPRPADVPERISPG